jgi:hypothetical protein
MGSIRRQSPSGERGRPFAIGQRAEEPEDDGLVSRGRGRRHRLPKTYAVAARRLPLRPAAHHSASDALVPPSVSAQRHGISRLSEVEGEASAKRKFTAYPIGYFHIDTLKSEQRRANSTSSSQSTERRSSPSSNCMRRWRAARRRLPASPDRRRPLQGPHDPQRQRDPLHHAGQYEFSSAGHQGSS